MEQLVTPLMVLKQNIFHEVSEFETRLQSDIVEQTWALQDSRRILASKERVH